MDSSSVAETAEGIVETANDTDIAVIIERLNKIIELLNSIDSGIKHIVAVALLLLAFYGVWKVFNNWYFGGV